MTEIGELRAEAEKVVLQRIVDSTSAQGDLHVLRLAEAYAWLVRQDQSHGGGTSTK